MSVMWENTKGFKFIMTKIRVFLTVFSNYLKNSHSTVANLKTIEKGLVVALSGRFLRKVPARL